MDFVTPDRKARFAQLGYLFKHTFTIFGRDLSIVRPIVKMSIYACIMLCVLGAGVLCFFLGRVGTGTLLILLFIFLNIYRYFYYNRVSLVLSRMVYVSACGDDPGAKKARHYLSGLHLQVFALGMMDMLLGWVRNSRNGESGLLMRLLLSGIAGLGDLVSHFLVPAVAVDRCGIRDSAGKLSDLKDNIPESLSGVFGISIMGRVVLSIMGRAYFVGVIVAILLGFVGHGFLPDAFNMPLKNITFFAPLIAHLEPTNWFTVFNWLPFCVIIFFSMVTQAIISRIVDAIKVVYYTLFYARVNHGDDLASELRTDLESYLTLGGNAGATVETEGNDTEADESAGSEDAAGGPVAAEAESATPTTSQKYKKLLSAAALTSGAAAATQQTQSKPPNHPILWSWVLTVGFLVFGAALLYWGGMQIQQARATSSWPTVGGLVEYSSMKWKSDTENHSTSYAPDIRYHYTVGDHSYTGTDIQYGQGAQFRSKDKVEPIIQRYSKGTNVAVHYNPDDPADAILEPGMHTSNLIWPATGLVALLLGVLMLMQVIRRGSLW